MTTSNSTSPFKMNSVQTAAQYINDLHQDHDAWRSAEKTASAKLDALLAKCLRLYELMMQDSLEAEALRQDFGSYVKEAKLRFNDDTHTIAKIAGVVFNRNGNKYNRRHASHYGRVLRTALDSGVDHAALPAFIASSGGVTKLSSPDKTDCAASAEDKADAVWNTVKDIALATVSGDALKHVTDRANVGQRVVLLATQQANATFQVHAVVRKSGVVNAAYATKHHELSKPASTSTAAQQQSRLDAARTLAVAETTA